MILLRNQETEKEEEIELGTRMFHQLDFFVNYIFSIEFKFCLADKSFLCSLGQNDDWFS